MMMTFAGTFLKNRREVFLLFLAKNSSDYEWKFNGSHGTKEAKRWRLSANDCKLFAFYCNKKFYDQFFEVFLILLLKKVMDVHKLLWFSPWGKGSHEIWCGTNFAWEMIIECFNREKYKPKI